MHMIFTEEELEWINTREFGWPIKDRCPENIRAIIETKKKAIDNQFGGDHANTEVLHRRRFAHMEPWA